MKKFVYKYFAYPISGLLGFLLAWPAKAVDEYGLQATGGGAGYNTVNPRGPDVIIGQIVNIVLAFIGVIFLILTIYAGFLWMTAGGNEDQIKKARGMLTASVIGLVIVLAAAIISGYVLQVLLDTFNLGTTQ